MSALLPLVAGAHISWRAFTPLTWALFLVMGVFMAWTIWRAVHLTVHPGETEGDHIKRQVLRDPTGLAVDVPSAAKGGAAPQPPASEA